MQCTMTRRLLCKRVDHKATATRKARHQRGNLADRCLCQPHCRSTSSPGRRRRPLLRGPQFRRPEAGSQQRLRTPRRSKCVWRCACTESLCANAAARYLARWDVPTAPAPPPPACAAPHRRRSRPPNKAEKAQRSYPRLRRPFQQAEEPAGRRASPRRSGPLAEEAATRYHSRCHGPQNRGRRLAAGAPNPATRLAMALRQAWTMRWVRV
mmetsp:Transcript_118750/g.335949  ORF Transcript_118750/g.335949 Transcript_118750/m.335949 type:complete len:210 (+) Transcript_118750:272-901(+)